MTLYSTFKMQNQSQPMVIGLHYEWEQNNNKGKKPLIKLWSPVDANIQKEYHHHDSTTTYVDLTGLHGPGSPLTRSSGSSSQSSHIPSVFGTAMQNRCAASAQGRPGARSRVRQNFHPECEAAVNRQINLELHAGYVYLSMAYYFARDDVALRNFAGYFRRQSRAERAHAEGLMRLQTQRGGRLRLRAIPAPARDDWGGGLQALRRALRLERDVNRALLALHALAARHADPHLCDFLETHYLHEQVLSIKELADHVHNLRAMGAPRSGLAVYLFDQHTLAGESKQD
ncbi:ferritin, mitochondrial [Perognathus longimembris pacificus]|uniref:ferritin, mitochondrial n=1 Tax=Perognathus longimembris pacificus TaxID=214514 RepID=UPI00201A1FE7|nr:ferritin, mitochondrial [Perognathus longimembris pacificus]